MQTFRALTFGAKTFLPASIGGGQGTPSPVASVCTITGRLLLRNGLPAANTEIAFVTSGEGGMVVGEDVLASHLKIVTHTNSLGRFSVDLIFDSELDPLVNGTNRQVRVISLDADLDVLITVPDVPTATLASLL